MPDVTITPTEDGRRRWLILAVVGLAQLMVISPQPDTRVTAAQAGAGPARPA